MLVDVVRMRIRGRKLPADEVRASKPTRGRLWISKLAPVAHDTKRELVASLLNGGDFSALPQLVNARVTSIRNGQLVVVGYEDARGDSTHRPGQLVPQAWWCRVVA